MHRDNPASRTLLGLAAGAIFVPLLVILCCNADYGLPVYFSTMRPPLWAGLMAAAALAVAVWGLLRSANVIRAAWLLGLILYGHLFLSEARPEQSPSGRLLIADYNGTSDVEVICNGVSLGRTPLVIDEADFYRRVPAWDVPPPQPNVECPHEYEGKPAFHFSSSWYWSPHTPFRDLHDHAARDDLWMHREETFMSGMSKHKYWWHFERDGLAGLKDLNSWGGGGGGSRIITYHTSLTGVTFPAVPRVVELLLQGLRDSDYRPSPEWMAFVLRHRQVLYRALESAAEDPRMEGVLDQLTRAAYEFPEDPSEADARRTLGRVFDDVVQRGSASSLAAPSMESRVIARLAPLASQFLVEEFRWQVPEAASSMGVFSPPNDGPESQDARGRRARREALFAALEHVQPPELFEGLVYLYAMQNPEGRSPGGQLLDIIARYRRPEAVALVRRRLLDQGNPHAAIGFATLDVPELEAESRECLVRNCSAGQFSLRGVGGEFFRSRVRRGEDLPQFIDWIATGQFLNAGQKVLLLVEIGNPQAGEWLNKLIEDQAVPATVWDEPIAWLAKHPRPIAAHFLLGAWGRLNTRNGHWSHKLLDQALLATDAPEIREHILSMAKGDPRRWSDFVNPPPEGPLSHLDWLVPVIAGFNDDFQRRVSCDLLAAIATPTAETLLSNWRVNSNPSISESAEKTFQKREQARADLDTRRQQLADLLASRITPQSLVTPKPFVWHEGRYERQ